MKTQRQQGKRSMFASMILLATALFAGTKQNITLSRAGTREGGSVWNPGAIFTPRRNKFKGYQREQHLGRRRSKYYFNKNR